MQTSAVRSSSSTFNSNTTTNVVRSTLILPRTSYAVRILCPVRFCVRARIHEICGFVVPLDLVKMTDLGGNEPQREQRFYSA